MHTSLSLFYVALAEVLFDVCAMQILEILVRLLTRECGVEGGLRTKGIIKQKKLFNLNCFICIKYLCLKMFSLMASIIIS